MNNTEKEFRKGIQQTLLTTEGKALTASEILQAAGIKGWWTDYRYGPPYWALLRKMTKEGVLEEGEPRLKTFTNGQQGSLLTYRLARPHPAPSR